MKVTERIVELDDIYKTFEFALLVLNDSFKTLYKLTFSWRIANNLPFFDYEM